MREMEVYNKTIELKYAPWVAYNVRRPIAKDVEKYKEEIQKIRDDWKDRNQIPTHISADVYRVVNIKDRNNEDAEVRVLVLAGQR